MNGATYSYAPGRALAIWRKALLAGPAASVDATLETLKQDDGLEACVCIAWMPANALAASPRRFVRLLGLNSSRWPRGIAEDRLIPDHTLPTPVLAPLPVNLADRRDFETILATTADTVVLSRARRDSDGPRVQAATATPAPRPDRSRACRLGSQYRPCRTPPHGCAPTRPPARAASRSAPPGSRPGRTGSNRPPRPAPRPRARAGRPAPTAPVPRPGLRRGTGAASPAHCAPPPRPDARRRRTPPHCGRRARTAPAAAAPPLPGGRASPSSA